MILCLEESVCCVCGINFFLIKTGPNPNKKVKKGAESQLGIKDIGGSTGSTVPQTECYYSSCVIFQPQHVFISSGGSNTLLQWFSG